MRLLDSADRVRLCLRLAALSSLGLAGCSVLFSLDSTQCAETSDCELLGGEFVGTVCEDSLCVTPAGMGGGDGDCTSNKECTNAESAFGAPTICKEGACIPLTLGQECPLVLGLGTNNENLFKPAPIIVGLYGPVDELSPTDEPVYANYDMAFNEMNDGTRGGISGGPGGSSRPFLGVLCKALNADLELSLGHLIDDLEVPALVAGLYADDLKNAFNTMGYPNDVFFLSPIDADASLTNIADKGLLWHMLSEGKDLAPAFVSLVTEAEAYVRQQRGLTSEPIKLALVDADTPFLTDIANEVAKTMTFNGVDRATNDDNGYYLRVTTESAREVAVPDISDAKAELEDFGPDLVVSVGSAESLQLIQDLDASWNPSVQPKPFYIVSPYVFGIPQLTSTALADVHDRMLGVNFAGAEDTTLYKDYLDRLESRYQGVAALDGKENFYDAAWFVMYAIAAAGNPARLTGAHVALGMERLINPDDDNTPRYDVGEDEADSGTAFLGNNPNLSIGLMGTLGPPDFNPGTGARKGVASIFCVDQAQMKVQDALHFDPATGEISGTQTCVPDFPVP